MRTDLPVDVSHRRTVVSELAVAMSRPSGLNATTKAESVWPSSVRTGVPVTASQIRAVASSLAAATTRSVGLNATDQTVSEWPFRMRRQFPVATSHSRARAVEAGGGDELAVRAERDGRHDAGVAGEHAQAFA